MRRVSAMFAAGLCAAMAIVTVPAHGSYIISIQQVGSNVVATGSGSIDTTDLTSPTNTSSQSLINGKEAQVFVGPTSLTANTRYAGATGPATLGTFNANFFASSGSGPAVGLGSVGTVPLIVVPVGYTSGTLLGTSTDTFSNQTLSGMGLNPGTYTYSWGTGPDADTLSVQVTPEPACITLFAAAGITLLRRHRLEARNTRRGTERLKMRSQR